MYKNLDSYGCYNRNDNERMKSSSGGVYVLLAKSILNEGGCIFAAFYNKELEVEHREINSINDLEASQGSKYVTSRLGDTFNTIKERIKLGKKVLFVGTPCQCAGLINFIGISENLYCVDFVCHGVPSRIAWRSYLKSLKKERQDIRFINMRNKESGWSHYQYSWEFVYEDENKSFQRQQENPFMKGFISNLFLRPSCYECKFKGLERNTDITLGDYWGVWKENPELDDNKGTSLVVIRTEKGRRLFHNIADELIYKHIELENAVQYNPSIIMPALYNPKRNKVMKQISHGIDFFKVIKKNITASNIEGLVHKFKIVKNKIVNAFKPH